MEIQAFVHVGLVFRAKEAAPEVKVYFALT